MNSRGSRPVETRALLRQVTMPPPRVMKAAAAVGIKRHRNWGVLPVVALALALACAFATAPTTVGHTAASVGKGAESAPLSATLTLTTATATPSPTPTPVPSPTPIPQGAGAGGTYCLGLLNWCLDLGGFFSAVGTALGGLLNSAITALFAPLQTAFSSAFTGMVAPFTGDLTSAPNFTTDASWAGLRGIQSGLQLMAGTLALGFLLLGTFSAALEALGQSSFGRLTAPLRRAVLIFGLIGGYQQVMGAAFTLSGGLAATINGLSLTAGESAWTALSGALGTMGAVFSIQGVFEIGVMVAGYILVILSVVVRYFGLGVLAALYAVGPLCLATYLAPNFAFIATWWVKTFLTLSLWPVGYALCLKLIALMLSSGGPLGTLSGFSAALSALGLVLVLYRVPAVVGSIAGAGGAVLGAVSSSVTSGALGAAVSAARATLSVRKGTQ